MINGRGGQEVAPLCVCAHSAGWILISARRFPAARGPPRQSLSGNGPKPLTATAAFPARRRRLLALPAKTALGQAVGAALAQLYGIPTG